MEPVASSSTAELSINDLREVLVECYGAKLKWYFIGLHLRIPPNELDSIEGQYITMDIRLRKMLQFWLQSNQDKSWKTLADAAGSEIVGFPNIQTRILEKKLHRNFNS